MLPVTVSVRTRHDSPLLTSGRRDACASSMHRLLQTRGVPNSLAMKRLCGGSLIASAIDKLQSGVYIACFDHGTHNDGGRADESHFTASVISRHQSFHGIRHD